MEPAPNLAHDLARVRFGAWDALVVLLAGFAGSVLLSTLAFALAEEPGTPLDETGWAVSLGAVVGQFAASALVLVLVSRLRGTGSLRDDFGLAVDPRDWWAVPLGAALQIGLGLVLFPLTELVDDRQDVVEALFDASGAELAVLAVTAIVLAPLFEELLFRGVLLRGLLRRTSVPVAIAVSALAFAATHLLDLSAGTALVAPAFVVLGALGAYYAIRTGTLSRSILLHAGFNLLPVLAALFG